MDVMLPKSAIVLGTLGGQKRSFSIKKQSMTEAQPKQRFQDGNVLRGFFGALFLCALLLLVEFWTAPAFSSLFLLMRSTGFLVLLGLGLLGLFHPRYKSYALGIIIFCILLVIPVFFLLVNLMTGNQVMRPL